MSDLTVAPLRIHNTGSVKLDEIYAKRGELVRKFWASKQPRHLLSLPKPFTKSIAEPLTKSTTDIKPLKLRIEYVPEPRPVIKIPGKPKIIEIQKMVASHFGISLGNILSKRRFGRIVFPRQIAMYLSKLLTPSSFAKIGRLACRDRTTVMHAVRKISALVEIDEALADEISVLKDRLLSS